MKIHSISDIHLEADKYDTSKMPDADVLILAGDIVRLSHMVNCQAQQFFEFVSKKYRHVLVVLGNHEYYKCQFGMGVAENEYRQFLGQFPNVKLLLNDKIVIQDVTFLGTTLWTDFDGHDTVAMFEAERSIMDFHVIKINSGRTFKPEDAWLLNQEAKQFLEKEIEQTKGKLVVITHFTPSMQCGHPKWGQTPLNHYFHNSVEYLMSGVDVWVCGHTHDSFDQKIGDTRVIINPKGYGDENIRGFKPDLVWEI
jgi:predicted phosphodiesterase